MTTAAVAGVRLADIAIPASGAAGQKGAGAFRDVLSDAISNVHRFGQEAQASTERFLAGEGEEVHQVVLSAQKAELAFELFLQVRNKVVQAYQEVMRMQL